MSTESKSRQPIKVTDRRIFTAEGEVREEFKSEVVADGSTAEEATRPEPPVAEQSSPPRAESPEAAPKGDPSANPETPFTNFIYSLMLQAYMSLGLIRNPYQQVPVEPEAARQLIDILTMLREKTEGNLTVDEAEFLKVHLAELKLAYVQQSKKI